VGTSGAAGLVGFATGDHPTIDSPGLATVINDEITP
jgi:hypothetical protein